MDPICWVAMTPKATFCSSLMNTNPDPPAPTAAGSCRPTPSGIGRVKKEKRTQKERRGQPDGNGRTCGKTKYSFSTRPCKTLGGVLHRSHRLHGRQSTNNKTGH